MLCESLTYERGPPTILNGNAVPGRPWTTVYSPPFDEFEVEHVSIPEKARFQGIQTYLPANPVSTCSTTFPSGELGTVWCKAFAVLPLHCLSCWLLP